MITRYTKRTLFILATVLITSSCETAFEKNPNDFLAPVNYYETESQLMAALAGTYDILGGVYGTVWLYRTGMEGDEGYFARSTPVLGPQNFNQAASDNDTHTIWRNLFQGINRANVLLANVNKNPGIPIEIRSRIRGETLFLRGYYYFVLAQLWGGVPIFITPTASAKETDSQRNSLAEVYTQILEDMKEAEALVPNINEIQFSGRINKSAVRGILARVCLYMAGNPLKDESKFAEARSWTLKVMEDDAVAHALNPSYSDVFIKIARDEYDIKESIFEVEFWGNRTDNYTETGYVGFANGPQTSNNNTGNGFGGIRTTAKHYRKYETGDLRRDWNIADFTYNNTGENGAKTMINAISESSLYNRQAAKFRREYETLLPKAVGQTPQNFPLLRYADVLLMFAEAENEVNNGPTQAAYNAINQVRRRAFGKLLPEAENVEAHDLYGLDYTDFKTQVQDERMRELAFEQMRKFDLIRWGIFSFEMSTVQQDIERVFTTIPYYRDRFANAEQEKHTVWPIPAAELMLNKLMTQNPGW
ncbi:RagB/SusD family nutrient uptake outer membrane protein [Sphingobacterium arenae]|uniref:RagB/SusD family nutrient uptake outer membrane protein n=1 Tax=Sphingobacterium arenae TaxID=1280598 RepID=A0ABR7Y2I9_9SPHI|nr:RagB/SusD family nutrient uptake outer membrane protein [Sphingobacterium arenae]MBD1425525.1 RagB/SusD family nutrient uptake outer membrane protein [Sphingobacterium arenae]